MIIRYLFGVLVIVSFSLSGCNESPAPQPQSCVAGLPAITTGANGLARVFLPDPAASAGILSLSPASLKLNDYAVSRELLRLGGRGVLEGRYVEVRDGLTCQGGFSAFEQNNNFVYSHSDRRFQEAMAYYFGDQYRAELDAVGVLQPVSPVRIVVHYSLEDNSSYIRYSDGGRMVDEVDLSDSLATRGASYADDGAVTIHELQHATTVNTYDPSRNIRRFWYDEAGALNEAVSDFMALMFVSSMLPTSFDPRTFSSWALGKFIPGVRGTRGAHRCPAYDPNFPDCSGFPGFAAETNTISYVYPDGLGWPYAAGFDGPGYARSAFLSFRGQEKPHDAAILMQGALWDVFEALRANHSPDEARMLMTKVVMKAIADLPKPGFSLSPISFQGFAAAMFEVSSALGFSADDLDRMRAAFRERGLLDAPELQPGWAGAGSVKIVDHPSILKNWLNRTGADPKVIPQGNATGLNGQVDAGEVVAMWFDLQNYSDLTAGNVYLRVKSLNPAVTFLDNAVNEGFVSENETHVVYAKVNGTEIVQKLSSPKPAFDVPLGNSYFRTNPYFGESWTTAVWVKVGAAAARQTLAFDIQVSASNAPSETVRFEVGVQ
ncbi:MAG TPA: hypothetical protein VJB59_12735 [Bdellovibrionota bacterium]|nr:hypothetical protein [Bdellovibrionota bacterium]